MAHCPSTSKTQLPASEVDLRVLRLLGHVVRGSVCDLKTREYYYGELSASRTVVDFPYSLV
ncbi:MAG: hypothetical protein ACREUD_08135 [Gammaproteobacteria bacterium]